MHMAGIHAESAQLGQGGGAYRVVGQGADESRFAAEVGQRDGDIGLAAAESGFEARRLQQALVGRRFQPQHDFAKTDVLGQCVRLLRNQEKYSPPLMSRLAPVMKLEAGEAR